jgi:transposase
VADKVKQHARDNFKKVIRETANVSKTAKILGVSRHTVYKWIKLSGSKNGLIYKKAGRPTGTSICLTTTQCSKLEVIICNNTPEQIGLPCLLWSSKAIRMLIEQKYNLPISMSVIRRLLKNWKFIPTTSAINCWGDGVRWLKSSGSSYRGAQTISDYIQSNKAQSYFMGILDRDNKKSSRGTHSIYAVTKRGHVKIMSVKWDDGPLPHDKKYIKSRNANRRKDILLFMKMLRKQTKKNIIVVHRLADYKQDIGTINTLSKYHSNGIEMIAISV